jgi:hypothetical protein
MSRRESNAAASLLEMLRVPESRVDYGSGRVPEILVFSGRFRILGIEPEFPFSTAGRVRRLYVFVYLFHLPYCVPSVLSTYVIAEV